jgi:site-specific recombinase XerD
LTILTIRARIYNMKDLISQYLESKKYAWSQTTLRSERYRLQAIENELDGNPTKLWESIQEYKPYARLTLWTRVTDFYEWLIEEGKHSGQNPYKAWRKKNAKNFKNVYVRRLPEIDFKEAKERIEQIENPTIRQRALLLLNAGLRFNESNNIMDGGVFGKGSKYRTIYASTDTTYVPHGQVYRALKKIGLTPHTLRKLFASRLVELGANQFELCKIMGWSNLNTASSYIAIQDKRIEELVSKI